MYLSFRSYSPEKVLPKQHFLYFRPLPQGQGSLRPTFFCGGLWSNSASTSSTNCFRCGFSPPLPPSAPLHWKHKGRLGRKESKIQVQLTEEYWGGLYQNKDRNSTNRYQPCIFKRVRPPKRRVRPPKRRVRPPKRRVRPPKRRVRPLKRRVRPLKQMADSGISLENPNRRITVNLQSEKFWDQGSQRHRP
jgi:hypothetical protein